MAIAIVHPGARLLAPALVALADVVAGDWTSAARLCAIRLRDPRACALDLDAAATRAGVARSERQPYRYRVHHRMLVVDEHPDLLSAALELQMKVWMGQWDALELVAPSTGSPVPGWRPSEVLDVRIRHQRPDAWSSRLYGCQNLSVAPTTARLAHHVLTKLDGGAVLHRYDVPAGPAAVHVG
jgi:integrase